MIDINKIEDEIKDIIQTDETSTETDFVLTTKNTEETLPVVNEEPELVNYAQMTPDQFDEDFEYVRNNLKDIVNQGSESLKQIISIASQSENPRAFEVVATLMKSLAEVNKDLLNSHKTKDDRNGITPKAQTNIQNNTVFVGSTAEFSKMMKNKLNGDK